MILRFLAFAAFAFHALVRAAEVPYGYLDVAAEGADPTCGFDSTSAIQAAVNKARDAQLALFFPPGRYCISGEIVCQQRSDSRELYPCVFVGSTENPSKRSEIVLTANSPGFNDETFIRAMIHIFKSGTTADEGGNSDLFNHGVISLDFRVEAGNAGAAAVRLQGAEGTTLQDLTIDLTTSGHTGVWGVPGSGGSTVDVKVTGGAYGIDTRKRSYKNGQYVMGSGGSQPQPVISGAVLTDQTKAGIYCATRGACVLVGSHISRSTAGSLVHSSWHWQGDFYDSSIQLVDCVLEYTGLSVGTSSVITSPTNKLRSYALENTYVFGAKKISDQLDAHESGWVAFQRAAVAVDLGITRPWGKPNEEVYVDGLNVGNTYIDMKLDQAPPSMLSTKHRLPPNFPSWETSGVVNVQDVGAVGDGVTDDWSVLQAAIDRNDILFFPKGNYAVSDTLTLRPTSKLIGVYHQFSKIVAISDKDRRFGGVKDGEKDKPIVETPDTAVAEVFLAFLNIKRTFPLSSHNPTPPGNYALSWRCGGASVVRHVEFQSKTATYLRPDLVAKYWYKLENLIDTKQPQKDFPDGMWAWPNNHPNILIHGNGGGKIYNIWCHGRQGMREDTPFIRIDSTMNELSIYHIHIQQQDSINQLEVLNSRDVTLFGGKAEIKGTFAYFENSQNVRFFGHGGLSSPDVTYKVKHLFRFVNCQDFLIAGINDDINEGSTVWVGGNYDKWVRTYIKDFSILLDSSPMYDDVSVPNSARPILYLRGDPKPNNDSPSSTSSPTSSPTNSPTGQPTSTPTATPTASPVTTSSPTNSPTSQPTSSPTATPTASPVTAAPPPSVRIGKIPIGSLNKGVAFTDSLVPSHPEYYIMYSETAIKARFPSATFHTDGASNLIGVRHDESGWWLDRGVWPEEASGMEMQFVPEPTDRLLCRLSFDSDTLDDFVGQSGVLHGIARGYKEGDLKFHINRWWYASRHNNNEVFVDGTYFVAAGTRIRTNIGVLNRGVPGTDSIHAQEPEWYIMYSKEALATRFAPVELHPHGATNLAFVKYSDELGWLYDIGVWPDSPEPLVPFSPVATDVLLAKVDFVQGTSVSFKKQDTDLHGMSVGYVASNLVFKTNKWNGNNNIGEVWVEGSWFERYELD